MTLLMWLFLAPFIASAFCLFVPASGRSLKRLAILLSLIPLLILACGYSTWSGREVDYAWIPLLSIHFSLKFDPLSALFVLLTAIAVPISLLAINSKTDSYPNSFYALILLLQGLFIGFFTASDLVLFTFFWEAMLVPVYCLITYWGGENRRAAAMRFLIYTVAGSALMVAAVIALYFVSGQTFDIETLAHSASKSPYAPYICAVFLLAFAVKTPLFPFHGWLPDAYCEATATVTILLSAILSKAGIYGFLRIAAQFFPDLLQHWANFLIVLAIVGVLYGGFAAWMQQDYKRLIAYSSISHVNFILAGIFIYREVSQSGAILQAFNHGITIAALFIAAKWLYDRIGTTRINGVSGLAHYLPRLCWMTLFFVLSSAALPGLNTFVGEIMILFGFFGLHPWFVPFLAFTTVLSVVYMLRWMQAVFFGPPSYYDKAWKDLGRTELLKALPIIFLILFPGIYPKPFLTQTDAAAKKIAAIEIKE